MDDMLRDLIDIEQTAKASALSDAEQQQQLRARIESARADIEKRVNDETDEKINEMRAQVHLETNARLAEVLSKADQTVVLLNQEFDDHHTEWEDEILQRIVYELHSS